MKEFYKTIEAPATGLYKEKGSRFIAYAYPLTSEDEVKGYVDAIKKEHFSARHHCYAYRIGTEGEVWRANDNGEPSSTAGKPILGQLLSNELTNILVVVVRYFGGIKLGVPGLINAYRTATADALSAATIVEREARENVVLSCGYEELNGLMKLIKTKGFDVIGQEFDNLCKVTISIRPSQKAEIPEQLVWTDR